MFHLLIINNFDLGRIRIQWVPMIPQNWELEPPRPVTAVIITQIEPALCPELWIRSHWREGQAFSPQKRTYSTSKNVIYYRFSIFVGHFCPPGSRSGSHGSRDPIESGSTALLMSNDKTFKTITSWSCLFNGSGKVMPAMALSYFHTQISWSCLFNGAGKVMPAMALSFFHTVSHQGCDLFYRLLYSSTRHIEKVEGGESDAAEFGQLLWFYTNLNGSDRTLMSQVRFLISLRKEGQNVGGRLHLRGANILTGRAGTTSRYSTAETPPI
jgi:hypothetical protein